VTAQFLWGTGTRPEPSAFVPRQSAWWQQYSKGLRLGVAAKKELYESCRDLIALLPDPQSWSTIGRPFRGLVVGAVQSGKTGSMIGLAAMALDQGYRIVVVLSGNKDDLRRQTARRFNVQLLRHSDVIPNSGGARTLPENETRDALPGFCLPYDRDAHQYAAFHNSFQAAIERGHAAVVVVKKHISSLADVRRKLEIAYERYGVNALPTLVLDDECDDASIDREAMLVPAAISGLWRRRGDHPLVSYVGYTATSAANLLQQRENDLFPDDFVSLLRYPSGDDSALSFSEPSPDLWYTGGHTYYEAFGDEPGPNDNYLIVTDVDAQQLQGPVQANTSLPSALRAYIVGGAYRLAVQPGWSLDDPARFPLPHSMLVQTSASQADHKIWLDAIVATFGGSLGRTETEYHWPADVVMREVETAEAAWRRWYDEFVSARGRVLEERPRVGSGGVVAWSQVKACIPLFIEQLRIKVINSDEAVGSDLDFAPRVGTDGRISRPQDLFVIVIGGAKLSRGLTIDGLCVTYFARWNPSPTEDTVLQLSRWYGYRGAHLEFCRLFTTPDIYGQLRDMEGNDRDLRDALATLMRTRKSPADAALVIGTNPRALPTAKLGEGKVHDLSFSPFSTVFRRVEATDVELQRQNQEVAHRLSEAVRARGATRVVAASGAERGLISGYWSAVEVADWLESFSYADHNPSAAANPAKDYYKRPDTGRPIVTGRHLLDDPYQIGAYLRQWAANGNAPVFNVGVAFGEMGTDIQPFDFPLVNREITPRSEVVGGWTGRRAGWRGDQLFDDPDGSQVVPGTMERQPGARGLLLMYVIHRQAIGRHGRGKRRDYHTPVLGIAIPDGGPTWRRVTVDRRGVVTE
jgi:hypothetical protein